MDLEVLPQSYFNMIYILYWHKYFKLEIIKII